MVDCLAEKWVVGCLVDKQGFGKMIGYLQDKKVAWGSVDKENWTS